MATTATAATMPATIRPYCQDWLFRRDGTCAAYRLAISAC
jgi:hypothetical protein